MRVVFRVDASVQIGTGHVMRCLTLADELFRQGHHCRFVCRDHQGHLGDLITSKGYALTLLPACSDQDEGTSNISSDCYASWLGVSLEDDAQQTRDVIATWETDWLVVDHYALDVQWERVMVKAVEHIMVIDDLANRRHECALLLDQNLGRAASDYDGLVPLSCRRLIGPRHALLRPEFPKIRARSLSRRGHSNIKRILISLGGVDRTNMTSLVLKALAAADLPESTELDIIMGTMSPHLDDVRELAAILPYKTSVTVNARDMAERMCLADISIGAAGGTAWERCCLGLPAVLIILAENQKAGAKAMEKSGAAIILDIEQVDVMLSSILYRLFDSEKLKRMSDAAAEITSGNGAVSAVQAMNALGKR